jgi:CubicO group peptidase (beta-lactamase class C family)
MRARAAVLLALPALAGCGGSPSTAPPPVADAPLTAPAAIAGDWPVARPDEVGLDAAAIAGAANAVRHGERGALHSLLVVRRGRLAVEEYFAGSSRDDVHTQQSVTKSVTSLLVGIALDQGLIRSVREPVLSFFPEYADLRGVDARRDAMTLEDLLTMRTGLLWTEEPYAGSDLERLNQSRGDWVRFVLEHPMREPPGTRWQYNSGGVIVLAGVLRTATGGDVTQYARRVLFEPLGIRGERWVRAPYDGLPHTGGGLSLRARDMARLGELVLRGGRAGERQVVSREWLEGSFAHAAGPIDWPRPVYYGRLWWLFPPSGPATSDVVTASGAGGQWIFVAPPLDLVVVFTADQMNPRFFSPMEMLFDQILSAVRN